MFARHSIRTLLAISLITLFLLTGCTAAAPAAAEPEIIENPHSGTEIMSALNIGWNLGNSFDAPEGELAWANPFTTNELLVKVKELGFDTIRIPISWGKHVSAAPEYQIDADFMARIDTVVHQALDAGLYVIIDSHHDNGIYTPTPENAEHGKEYLKAIWTQIGEHFRDTDYRLLFQTMNEPRVEGTSYEWEIGTMKKDHKAIHEVINALNQTAVDVIRATGGKNEDRYIVVCPYAGKLSSAAVANFRLPTDSAEGKLIVSIHVYSPYNLCLNTSSPYNTFSQGDRNEVENTLKRIDSWFVQKGIPVVIDEMGCTDKSNPDARYEWAHDFVSCASGYGIPCIWWDNGYLHGTGDNFGMINRNSLALYPESESVYRGLMDGLHAEE